MGTSRNAFLAAFTLFMSSLFAATALAQEPVEGASVPVEAAAPADGNGAGGKGDGKDETPPADPDPDAPDTTDGAQKSEISLRIKGLRSGKLPVGESVKVLGTLRPFVKGERVGLVLYRGGKAIDRKNVTVDPNKKKSVGEFTFSDKLLQPGRYSVQAVHNPTKLLTGSKGRTKNFQIRYPDLDPGQANSDVRLFNNALRKVGYVPGTGESYNGPTQRAVLAYRKVNDMSRVTDATADIFKAVAAGKSGFNVKHPEDGRHVEADLSRQIMVLVDGDRAEEIYHISSGAPATPTIPGKFHFYRKEPGFNNVGMYFSVYYQGGYATHGYPSVPTGPASHGCLRNPIPDSVHIYNWIDIGMPIWVYN